MGSFRFFESARSHAGSIAHRTQDGNTEKWPPVTGVPEALSSEPAKGMRFKYSAGNSKGPLHCDRGPLWDHRLLATSQVYMRRILHHRGQWLQLGQVDRLPGDFLVRRIRSLHDGN